jgi:hypothetical protein
MAIDVVVIESVVVAAADAGATDAVISPRVTSEIVRAPVRSRMRDRGADPGRGTPKPRMFIAKAPPKAS